VVEAVDSLFSLHLPARIRSDEAQRIDMFQCLYGFPTHSLMRKVKPSIIEVPRRRVPGLFFAIEIQNIRLHGGKSECYRGG